MTCVFMEENEIIQLNSVDQYNQLFGLETLHPLVGVVNLAEATRYPLRFTINYGIYALFLKDIKCGDIRYGRQKYDYEEGTIVSFAPGQVAETEIVQGTKLKAKGILFHPDLIKGTSLGQEIKSYSFFSYSSNEALHLSEEEKEIILDCLDKIKLELTHPIDKLSKRLIARNIQLLLDYCMRFYNRQFVTRAESNHDTLSRFESLLDNYFQSGKPQSEGLPTVKYFADRVFLSPNYFGDLIKKETGKTAQEYIQNKLIGVAKELIAGTDKSVSEIAYELGFQYSQHFNRIFKKKRGLHAGRISKTGDGSPKHTLKIISAMTHKIYLLICLCLLSLAGNAQSTVLESLSFDSQKLGRKVSYSIYLPADYNTSQRNYPRPLPAAWLYGQ